MGREGQRDGGMIDTKAIISFARWAREAHHHLECFFAAGDPALCTCCGLR